ncbi:Quinolinate synthetase [hydrothermal vent metagenome]|uniref:quinolinate synthase n=1 Tax=hydrothermal vent metagenome TaxID=652676 RepID=A0A3B0Y0H1_9ZZZZ
MSTITLAHYYTEPEVQAMADFVGDSLDLSLAAQSANADRIVFAGVRFMAETAKLLNPAAVVILPDTGSTCSLVTQTDITKLRQWRQQYSDHVHVAYINSSVEHKCLADWIVTSRNVVDVISHLYAQGKKVIFSPDYNMGAWLNSEFGFEMPLWSAVCEVHDKFTEQQVDNVLQSGWSDGKKYLLAHPESPLAVLQRSDLVGSTSQMLDWVRQFPWHSATIYVATESGLLHNMRQMRPDLRIEQLPVYKGCQCNSCPYMKLNTVDAVLAAQAGNGVEIKLDANVSERALLPVNRMLEFSTQQLKKAATH